MALMDAKEYDPRPAQRLRKQIIAVVAAVLIPLGLWFFIFHYYYWPQRQVVNKLFAALERQDFDTAYGIYNADPGWKQHAAKYNGYSLSQFTLDWGPSGDYGKITKHQIDCVLDPARKGSSSGVIVVVIINNRTQPLSLWVEKVSKTITISPDDVQCHPPS